MSAKKTIRKIAFITLWLCIAGGMFTLLMAAISSKNKGRCSGYSITINDVGKNYFIDQKDVEELLMKAANGSVKGQKLATLNLHELETALSVDELAAARENEAATWRLSGTPGNDT